MGLGKIPQVPRPAGRRRQTREVEGRLPDVRWAEDPRDPAWILRGRARVPGGQKARASDPCCARVGRIARARQLSPLDDSDRAAVEIAGDLVERGALSHFRAEDVLARD